MSFPRYPKYKDSGVEWLGQVPQHWEVKRLKRACHVFPSNVDKKSHDGETPVLLCNYTDVYYNETITAGMDFMAATASPDQIAKFTLRAGDTIITKDSETADDIAVGAYVLADLPGVVCGYHLSMVRPLPDTDGAFVKRVFDSTYAKSCFEVRANGLTRVGLGQYELDNVELPFPPRAEQTAIAAFLDRETAKLDALVAEQQRLMELLKEKRQAVISHAVTKGLNPKAPMKPSGIEWLGDIPEHWRHTTVRHLVEEHKQGFYTKDEYVEDGTPLLRITDLRDDTSIEFEDCPKLTLSENERQQFGLKIGDFVFVRSGASIGKFGIVEKATNAVFGSYTIRFRFRKTTHRSFLKWAFQSRSFLDGLFSSLHGGAISNVNADNIKDQVVAIPPVAEQLEVAAYLEKEIPQISTLTAEAQRAIDLLQERRTALISAAVTGQIDVRQLATAA